jgi:UDP-2,3-diacylglucosamine pyrophosphatase LpxH
LNTPINWFRKLFGLSFWSLSAAAKRQVKSAVNYIGAFESAVARLVKMEKDVQGVVCGHIHTPAIRNIGDLEYFNSGDWVESLTALIEDQSGVIQLVVHTGHSEPLHDSAPETPAPAVAPLGSNAVS